MPSNLSLRLSTVSWAIPRIFGIPPAANTDAATPALLLSYILPGISFPSKGTNSSPVARIETNGRRMTLIFWSPKEANTLISEERMMLPDSNTN